MNIIQLQDRLKGMPTEVIIQNLQNPTGAVPTYLLAGELSRRQKMEAEAAAEMPSDTVTEQLVEESMPQQNLGAMAPQSMAPQPVPPEQAMAAPGVAGLPAPNVGQNYAGGGIVSFAEGGRPKSELDIGEDLAGDLAVEAALISLLGPAGTFAAPSEMGNSDKYTAEELSDLLSKNYAGGGIVSLEEGGFLDKLKSYYNKGLGNLESGLDESIAPMLERDRIYQETGELSPMTEADLDTALNFLAVGKAGKAKKVVQKYGQKAWDKIKEMIKPQPKPTPKKQPKATPKKQPKATSKKQQPVAPGEGKIDDLLTSGLAAGVKYGSKGAGALYRGAKANPLTTGLVGLGGLAMYNSAQEAATEKARQDLEKTTKAELEQARADRERKEYIAKQQAYLDDLQAKKDKQKQRELYLALALGGAKTMQGESPYALQNVGAGLETGVSTMSAFDIARADREAELAKAGANLDFEYLKMAQGAEEKYRDQMIDILDSDDYQAYKRDLQIQVDDEDISEADMALNLENYIINRIGTPPSIRQATVGNKQFTQI